MGPYVDRGIAHCTRAALIAHRSLLGLRLNTIGRQRLPPTPDQTWDVRQVRPRRFGPRCQFANNIIHCSFVDGRNTMLRARVLPIVAVASAEYW